MFIKLTFSMLGRGGEKDRTMFSDQNWWEVIKRWETLEKIAIAEYAL